MVIAQPIARKKDLISMFRERYVLLNSSLERLSITFSSHGKREFVPLHQFSLFTCRLPFIISTHKLVSRNFLSIRIVLSRFYMLIFYFEKFPTWICLLPCTWRLKLSIIVVKRLIGLVHRDPFHWPYRAVDEQFHRINFSGDKAAIKGSTCTWFSLTLHATSCVDL